MKVLHINTLFTPRRYGGAEVFIERFSEELIERGHQVLVASLSPTPERRGTESLQVHEFKLRNISWPWDGDRPSGWRKAVWHLRNSFGSGSAADIDALLAREKPDVVHTHNLTGLTTAVWKVIEARKIPLVHTIHDYALLCPTTTMLRKDDNCTNQCISCRLLSWPKRGHSKAVKAVVGCSRFVLDRHVRNGYFSKAEQYVIHNGDPSDKTRQRVAKTKNGSALRVGYLGRLAGPKGIESMLDALAPSVPAQCEVLVAGSGDPPYESMLKRRYEPRGVQFLGRVDATTFLSRVDVLVVPSLWNEPCPLVLGEAMSAGVPILASTVGGIPEVVEHGRCGFLFEPADGEGLRQYVTRLAADRALHEQMSQSCRDQAETHTFDSTMDKYLNVYAQAMN